MVNFLDLGYMIREFVADPNMARGRVRRARARNNEETEKAATQALQDLITNLQPISLNYMRHPFLRVLGQPVAHINGDMNVSGHITTIDVRYRNDEVIFNLQGPESTRVLEYIVR